MARRNRGGNAAEKKDRRMDHFGAGKNCGKGLPSAQQGRRKKERHKEAKRRAKAARRERQRKLREDRRQGRF